MASRLTLHEKLVEILGTRNVYFQPPESIKMVYPCIVYNRKDIRNTFADDDVYQQKLCYQVIVIDRNPDSEIVFKMSKFPTAKFNNHYASDSLNHDVFTIYY